MRTIATALALLLTGTIMADVDPIEEKSEEQRAFEMVEKGQMGICASMMKKEPYLSIMPYSLDKGSPVVYISDLAQHTENLNKKSKSSFLVMKEDPKDIHNSARVTFQGKLVKVTDDKEVKRLYEDYVKKFPHAKIFKELHDFNFYRMEATAIHFIGGFGDISWLDVKEYAKAAK
jgi:putative heme iron utilization protein